MSENMSEGLGRGASEADIPEAEIPGTVVHVLSGKPYDRYVGRQNGRYGLRKDLLHNPYKVARDLPLADVLSLFESHMQLQCRLDPEYREAVKGSAGQTLACWCSPKDGVLTVDDETVCHAQIILRHAKFLVTFDEDYERIVGG